MSANANNLPSQHARSTNPPQATASGGAKQRASEEEPQFTLKPFKISKVATAAQRRAHRQASIGATDARKEEFGMLYVVVKTVLRCSKRARSSITNLFASLSVC